VDAYVLGVSPAEDDAAIVASLESLGDELEEAVAAASLSLPRRLRIRFDGVKQLPPASFPERGLPAAPETPPTLLGLVARFEDRVPTGAAEFTFGASRAFGPVRLEVIDEKTDSRTTHLLDVAADSEPIPLDRPVAAVSRTATFVRYLTLGFEHILPLGVDHILFVLGLFLLSAQWRPLLLQVSAFTVAHTLTLALSMAGVVSLSPRIVEPLIALSIAYVAIENIATGDLKPWRPAVVFGFGLLHGLGFAGVLRDLGLPAGEFVPALVAFNLGVEAGQLAVLLLAFALLGWCRKADWYRAQVTVPASLAIALVGLFWAVTRTLG